MTAGTRIDRAALERTLCQLGRVERLEDLGRAGPLLASAGAESLFHCLFGRDAIRMALDLLDDFPAVARATLLELARLQGVRNTPRAEEEPGRILHEDRPPDDALLPGLELVWSFPYYGAVDSTPRWINLLAAYTARVGDAILTEEVVDRLGRRVTLFDSLLAALGWVLGRMDHQAGGGYLWVRRALPDGIANQVWEDSSDSYYHEDGTLFDFSHPYAPVAVQGYVYDALLGAAALLRRTVGAGLAPPASNHAPPAPKHIPPPSDSISPGLTGTPAPESTSLEARAADLRACFLRDFWQPDLGTFALALTFDGHCDPVAGGRPGSRPARVVASSPGHLLASRLLDGDDVAGIREHLIRRLFEDDLLAGAGIRTRATGSARFRAGSYHNGSVWPFDTGVIADGLRRHGHAALADDLEARVLRACAEVGGFPEFFRGEPDGRIAVNTATVDQIEDGVLNRLEQPPQPYQGWTATRVWRALRSRESRREGSVD
jgi:glycogen debranching enzyme